MVWTLALILKGWGRQESGRLDLLGSKNRVITHAIGLQFVGWWATICLQPYQFLAGRLAARLVEGEMHLHPLSDKDLKIDLVSEIASLAESLFCIPPLHSKDI